MFANKRITFIKTLHSNENCCEYKPKEFTWFGNLPTFIGDDKTSFTIK